MDDSETPPQEKKFDEEKKEEHTIPSREDDVVFEDEDASQKDALKRLREKLNTCLSERQEYLDGWQRARADFVNARRVEEESRSRQAEETQEDLLKAILPTLDSFERAMGDAKGWQSAPDSWRTGVEQIYEQLLAILKQYEVCSFDSLGEVFDPHAHEPIAMTRAESAQTHNKVVEVFEKGYRRGEKILRPARVVVSVFEPSE